MNRLVTAIAVILLAGCQAKTDDLNQFIEQSKANTSVNIEPYPEFKTQPAFEYKAASLRSPFSRPKNKQPDPVAVARANCLQPDYNRQKHPLEAYGMDALTLSGTFTSAGKQWILVKANDGTLHKATTGDHLGLFFGKIMSISNDNVVIMEMLPDGAGCWQQKEVTLSMSSQAGENGNV